MSSLSAARPAVMSDAPGSLRPVEGTPPPSRREALDSDRRTRRIETIVTGVAVGLGSAGTLAFAAVMVVVR
jgi:hypothetical protein